MQSSEIVLYNLSKQAHKENYQYDRLYRHFYNKDFYIKAFSKIGKHKESTASKIEGKTDDFGEGNIQAIIQTFKDESYRPAPAPLAHIPMKKSKARPSGIPGWADDAVQEIGRMLLQAIYEPVFSDDSHGFRDKRNCHTALEQVKHTFSESNWLMKGEIQSFFDQIDHQVLISILRKRIKDEKFIRLIWKFLKAGYLENWRFHRTYSGTPQGGILSPVLANIYLHELDEYITNEVKPLLHSAQIGHGRHKRLHESIAKPEDDESENQSQKSLKYVRYADSFLIGISGNKEDCRKIQRLILAFLKNQLQLEMPAESAFITHRTKPVRFLSYDITISRDRHAQGEKGGAVKRKSGYVQLRIPKGTIEKFIVERKMVRDINAKQWDILHRPSLMGLSDAAIIETYNAELRGIYNYYSLAENVSPKMWSLRHVMEYSCLKTLAGKYKSSVAKMKVKYKQGKHWGVKYSSQQGEKAVCFYKDGFRKKTARRGPKIDVKPNLYPYRGKRSN